MELQWPLILFTTFVAASCGLFAAQGVYALKGEAKEAQMPALWTSFVLLVVGGIAVFFHLQHWERIFNGFGHITSGITQELIFIVALVVVMVVYFADLRRNGAPGKAVAWCAVVFSAVLVLVAGHSYMMPSRPAWDTFLGPLSLLGAALGAGPATFELIASLKGGTADPDGAGNRLVLWGSVANAALVAVYVAAMTAAGSAFTSVGYSFDPTHPTEALASAAAYGPFASGTAPFSVGAIVCAVAALAVAAAFRKKPRAAVFAVVVALAVASALLLRVAFYLCGGDVFMLY